MKACENILDRHATTPMRALWFGFLLLASIASAANSFTSPIPIQTLTSGPCQLEISTNPASVGVKVSLSAKSGAAICFQTMKPLMVEVLDVSGATNWLSTHYSSVVPVDGALRCAGEIRNANGTVFEFTDTYRAGKPAGLFMLERQVTLRSPATKDAGFMTRFSLESSQPLPLCEQEVFIPGVWYQDNQHVPAYAAGNRQVLLSWMPVLGANAYVLNRSANSAGPFIPIASGLTFTNFIDTNAVSGQTNFYTVASVSPCGMGTNSPPVTVFLPQPSLGVSVSTNSLILSWPGWANDWLLYSTTNLTPPVVWSPISNNASSSNGQILVNLPLGSMQQSFRLSSP